MAREGGGARAAATGAGAGATGVKVAATGGAPKVVGEEGSATEGLETGGLATATFDTEAFNTGTLATRAFFRAGRFGSAAGSGAAAVRVGAGEAATGLGTAATGFGAVLWPNRPRSQTRPPQLWPSGTSWAMPTAAKPKVNATTSAILASANLAGRVLASASIIGILTSAPTQSPGHRPRKPLLFGERRLWPLPAGDCIAAAPSATFELPITAPLAAITGVGIDFGTTNSVVALARADGSVATRHWPSAAGPTSTFRTALAFWREGRNVAHAAGPQALVRAEAPGEGRFIQSLKTHLASRAFSETRLFGKRFTVEELVALFLRDLLGEEPVAAPVAAGRPVVFAGHVPDEALAIARLHTAYAAAGLPGATLAYEPLGAAYWYARDLRRDETVLVADFGGGTSDFSVLRFSRGGGPDGRLHAEPLAHSGVGLAGDTFDTRIVEHAVAPRLGKGATFRSFEKELPVPAYIHSAFSQWHQLSWLKSGTILADLRKLAATSARGDELEALATVVEMDMGLALYRAVGEAKAALSASERTTLRFAGWGVAVEAEIARADFEGWIARDLAAIDAAVDEALARAGLDEGGIDAVFLTGGTSFVPAVRALFARRFPAERLHQGDAFQSVASGLALLAADGG